MDYSRKSSLEEIRTRFDKDVERFSDLNTGQQTVPDAGLMLELCTSAAAAATPRAKTVLDIGCGAGNFTLKLLEKLPGPDCRLVDLSQPMLNRAEERISAVSKAKVFTTRTDILSLDCAEESTDIILAGAVLHHLREEEAWMKMFSRFYRWLRPGGSIWITDLVEAEIPALRPLFNQRYADFLETLGGAEYRQKVLEYIAQEDSPRSVSFQLECLRLAGFSQRELLHKNGSFAAFGAVK